MLFRSMPIQVSFLQPLRNSIKRHQANIEQTHSLWSYPWTISDLQVSYKLATESDMFVNNSFLTKFVALSAQRHQFDITLDGMNEKDLKRCSYKNCSVSFLQCLAKSEFALL